MDAIRLLSIVIVNYKNQHLITQCVQSIVDFEKTLKYEIIVVDNHSNDDSESVLKAICPELIWIQMGYNSGYGRANNIGMQKANGKYLLLLNPDITIKETNTLFDCVEYFSALDDRKQMVMGVRLVNADESYQETLRTVFPSMKRIIRANPFYILIFDRLLKKNKKEMEKQKQKNAHYFSGKVAWINGAFLLMGKKAVLEKSLWFDEDFFLYGEDIEWCWRAHKQDMSFLHWHEKELIHLGSASMPNDLLKRCQITVSDWMMTKKTRGGVYFFVSLILESTNLIFDDMMYFFAKIRGKKTSEIIDKESKYRKIFWYLFRKYGLLILFKHKLSTSSTFYTNCYEDPILKRKS